MRPSLALAVLLVLGTSSVTAAPGAHGPNGEHLNGPAVVTPNGLARLPDGSLNVPMLAQRRLEIRTRLASETEAAATVQLPARVVTDPNASGRVQTVVGGKVEAGPKGLPVAGQAVKRGEVLAYIVHHAEPLAVAGQQAHLAELRGNRQIAEQRLARLQSLEGTVPRKEIDAARVELESLRARERALVPSLHAREALVAPITGVISRADVVSGQVVESKDVLFEVIDPSRVLVEATTSSPSLPSELGAAYLSDVRGVTLKLIGAARSLRDGVLPMTFAASNQGATGSGALPLAIGQPVTVVAELKTKAKGIVLPGQAVTRSPANEAVVWIKSGAERYIPQPVRYQTLAADTVLVTHGLGPDNRVVVQGASLLAQIR